MNNSLHSQLDREFPAEVPQGRLNPALLTFNVAVGHNNIVRVVRRWIMDQPLQMRPINPQHVAQNIIDEARARIVRFEEDPLTALSLSAVLNTIVYRDNSMMFDPLVAQARQAFSARL
jgi:hypothetical protein